MDNIVTRAYEFNVNAGQNDKGNEIDGKPIVYESKTDIGGEFAEIIDKGALDKTDLKDVRFLVNHDMTRIPLARSRNNNANSTMQMSVDDSGMRLLPVISIQQVPWIRTTRPSTCGICFLM